MSKEAASEVTGSFSYAVGLKKDKRNTGPEINQFTRDKHMEKVQEEWYDD